MAVLTLSHVSKRFAHGPVLDDISVFVRPRCCSPPVYLLSYGERTKLALALLVSTGATLLLLDEPASHLDPLAREHIEAALIDGGRVQEVEDRQRRSR